MASKNVNSFSTIGIVDLNAGNSILGVVNNELKRVTNPQLNVTTITANNLVYNTGSQNISGSKTFLNSGIFSLSGAIPLHLPSNPLSVVGSGNTYVQLNIQNRASGTNASADLVITANNGTDSTNYINLGINNVGYNDSAYTNGTGYDGYLFIDGGDLDIGTRTPGKAIEFHAGGTTQANTIARINQSGLNLISGNLTVNNGSLTVNGNLNSAGNYYVKVARLSDQTILQDTDTNIRFSTITDPNNWYNPSTYRITPTISGNYCANLMVSWKQGSAPRTIQTNIQIRKAGNTFAISQVPVESGLNFSVYACGITNLNGTASDYIEATAYSANPTSQNIIGEAVGTWTKMEVFKLN